jgi:hypothetical protein
VLPAAHKKSPMPCDTGPWKAWVRPASHAQRMRGLRCVTATLRRLADETPFAKAFAEETGPQNRQHRNSLHSCLGSAVSCMLSETQHGTCRFLDAPAARIICRHRSILVAVSSGTLSESGNRA